MKVFHQILGNSLIATVTNNFLWFALTYWVYLETQSVLASSLVGGIYLVLTTLSGFWFGSIVDNNKKKTAMMVSSLATLVLFLLGYMYYRTIPPTTFADANSHQLWSLIVVLLVGTIAGNIRHITLPTLVTILVPAKERDKANGVVGTVVGLAFSITAFASGIGLAYLGMGGVILVSIGFTILTMLHLATITIPEKEIVHAGEKSKGVDIKGTLKIVKGIPGLYGLIFFNVFNNFLGGVFMALMDAYGLSLVSVKVWGFLWGGLSFGFIFGGLYIAKKGLGPKPIKTLFTVNIILWILSIIFPIQPWIVLMTICMLGYMSLIPFIEAAEQTVLQKVVPLERQGRVFGFAQSLEMSASPLTAFMIGPIAQFIFIPFMTTGAGVELIGDWFGVGQGRGIALVFIVTGIIGLVVTVFAMRSKSYKLLSAAYAKES